MTDTPRLDLIGFGVRSGAVVVGTGGVRTALQRNELLLVVVPADVSRRTSDKVVRLAEGRGIPVAVAPSAVALGQAVGRDTVQAIGVKDRNLARGILPGLTQVQEGSRRH